MSEAQRTTETQRAWMGFEKRGGPGESMANRPTRTWFAAVAGEPLTRLMLGWGGVLVGLGLGSCTTWAIHIYELGTPSLYPSMIVTALIVFAASLAIGFGLSAFAAALISTRNAAGTQSNLPSSGAAAETMR
jgi:hypothetical protein